MSPATRRFFKYTLVGVSTFLIDLVMLYIAVSVLGIPLYIATPCSFLIAVSGNYILSRRFVFIGTKRSWHGGYLYFALVAGCGALVTTGFVAALVSFFGMYYLIARCITATIIGVGNYLFNLYINFNVVGKHPNRDQK